MLSKSQHLQTLRGRAMYKSVKCMVNVNLQNLDIIVSQSHTGRSQLPICDTLTREYSYSKTAVEPTSLSTMKRPRKATPSSVKTLYFLLISLFKSDTRGYFNSPTPPSFLSAGPMNRQ